MNELPLLFSGPMVRAINADIKTMTRRTRGIDRVNADPAAWIHIGIYLWPGKDRISATFQHRETGEIIDIKCPYGNPGDRLWIRETFRIIGEGRGDTLSMATRDRVQYRADRDESYLGKYRPSIHMPRWASRTDLDIVSVHVERLMGISLPDAISEGVETTDQFADLWLKINGEESWYSNPWVWVIGFKRVKP